MHSGCEDTLEEQYAIQLCFKLGKNARETYGMLQTAFGLSCMNRASVFVWHKRFKEGRESVKDDERCWRSKEVRTPELIGQIKNFMDKDCCVSIETIRVHSWRQCGNCTHNYSWGTEDVEDFFHCWQISQYHSCTQGIDLFMWSLLILFLSLKFGQKIALFFKLEHSTSSTVLKSSQPGKEEKLTYYLTYSFDTNVFTFFYQFHFNFWISIQSLNLSISLTNYSQFFAYLFLYL